MPAIAVNHDAASANQLDQALDQLQAASKLSVKERSLQEVKSCITTICNHAQESGLSALALRSIIDIVTQPNFLHQSSLSALIKALFPAGRVPSDLICIIVSSLGQAKHKPTASTQHSLLKWIIMVYEIVEDSTIFSKLYGVLFNLLDMISIRAPLCHLLATITRRKHIKPFRVQMLIELSRSFSHEPALNGLIQVYRHHYPELAEVETIGGRASQFAHPDPEWRERLQKINESNLLGFGDFQSQPSSFKVFREGSKRIRLSIIPEVHTYHADEFTISLEEVENVDDLVEKLDKIELPSQMIAVLDDPLLQKYLVLRPNETAIKRIDRWLALFFDEQLIKMKNVQGASKTLVDVLGKLLGYTRYTKKLPKSALAFLKQYLLIWDGRQDRELILGLLSYVAIRPFEELQEHLFNHLENAILDNTPNSACALLNFYSSILSHWTVFLISMSPSSTPGPIYITPAFAALANHASYLSLSILVSYPPTISTFSSILSYLEVLSYAISHAPTTPGIHITTPDTQTIYLLLFLHPSLSTLSRLCSTLAIYKHAFVATMTPTPTNPSPHKYPPPYLNHFNGFLMDTCNLLYRSRAFNKTDTNALGCLLPPSLPLPLQHYLEPQDLTLTTLFSLSHHSSLCALSIAAFRDLEDTAEEKEEGSVSVRHAGPVGQRSLMVLKGEGGLEVGWAEYRLEVLRWLGERGVGGIGELMGCTMKQLMGVGEKGGGVMA